MIKRGGGSIINVGFDLRQGAYRVLPALAHMAAKGGVIAVSETDRMEAARTRSAANHLAGLC